MVEIISSFILWILFWVVGWASISFAPKENFDYIENYVMVSLYFIFISMIIIYSFRDILDPIFHKLSFFPLAILLVFFIFNFLSFILSRRWLHEPKNIIEKYPTMYLLKMDYRYIISKSFDIWYQQILIVVLIFLFAKAGLDMISMTIAFGLIFGIGHIPMLHLQNNFFGYLFLICSILSALLFPFVILNFQYGFIYSYIIHWLFYTNSGLFFWILGDGEHYFV